MVLVALSLLACTPDPVDDSGSSPFDLQPPQLSCVTLVCDVDASTWRLDAVATSWTGGGLLYWTPDGVYVESHPVRSRSAAPDGSSDELRLELDIVGDWREASSGNSTALRCTDDPSALFLLSATDGQVAQCSILGDPAVWDGIEGPPSCPATFPWGCEL